MYGELLLEERRPSHPEFLPVQTDGAETQKHPVHITGHFLDPTKVGLERVEL